MCSMWRDTHSQAARNISICKSKSCGCGLQDWDPEDRDLPPLPTHKEMGISSTAHRALRAFRHLICDARAFGRSAPLTDTLWHLLRKVRRNCDPVSPAMVPCSTIQAPF